MRPKSIVYFEALYLASLAIGLVQSYLGWDELAGIASPAFILSVQLFTFGLIIALTLFVSRRRIKVALWILLALFVVGLPLFLQQVASGSLAGSGWIAGLQFAMQLVAMGLAFTPSARSWLNHDRAVTSGATQTPQ
jgi:hypothetical protein